MTRTILVTGGAGFIGSALVRRLIRETDRAVVNVDSLTYAGHRVNIAPVASDFRHYFEQVDICKLGELQRIFREHEPQAVVHLAAESHVDRSIDGPADFLQTNVVGTYNLLEVATQYWQGLDPEERTEFRFLHVSTDEVYGELGEKGRFDEATAYDPRSPYSATKAAADHLVRAWHHTYGLPTLVTNTCNNYGPYQFPEKLIPLAIGKALLGQPIPVYGTGDNVRDWIYVEDHVRGLVRVLEAGTVGETYLIGAREERRNVYTVRKLCALLDELVEDPAVDEHAELITFVEDRPGHDHRYAVDPGKIEEKLGWEPQESFESGLEKTVMWYLENQEWCDRVMAGTYDGERLGQKGRSA